MSTWGIRASSLLGSRQVNVPSSSSTAGSSTQRTSRASRNTAAARAEAELLDCALVSEHERQEYAYHDRRRRGDHAAGQREPVRDRSRGVAGAYPLLTHAGDQEDLVVRRRSEYDREDQHRYPRLDRTSLDTEHAAEPAPLEYGNGSAESSTTSPMNGGNLLAST
jgi:hypothetical protein